MRLSTEAALMLVAVALYLLDSCWLLGSDEAVLTRGARGRWFAGFGAQRWRLAGREPYVPNPLTPHRPQFRLRWRFDAPAADVAAGSPIAVPAPLRGVTACVWSAALCLFALLPVALFVPMGHAFTLSVLAALYVSIIAALVLLTRRRTHWGLSTKQTATLAFECMVCPPFAVNLVRKLCARQAANEDFTAAARRMLGPDELAHADRQCLSRIDEAIEVEGDDSPRARRLTAARARFTAATR